MNSTARPRLRPERRELPRTDAQPYTGCNPRGLVLAHDKDLSKKLLAIIASRYPRSRSSRPAAKISRPSAARVSPDREVPIDDGSMGISQASVVNNDEELGERVRLHPRTARHRGDRRAVHRRPRNLRRRARQRAAASAAGVGAAASEKLTNGARHRHRAREAQPEIPRTDRRKNRPGRRYRTGASIRIVDSPSVYAGCSNRRLRPHRLPPWQ